MGLEGLLDARRDALTGIVNGIDTDVWNPATDPHLVARYGPATLEAAEPPTSATSSSASGSIERHGSFSPWSAGSPGRRAWTFLALH